MLDYVACWYRRSAELMESSPHIRGAFFSTNSVTQGEQVGILWSDLQSRGIRINFAHRTFEWTSEARGRAAVHCAIIGFAKVDAEYKRFFDYETLTSDSHETRAGRINPYLVDASDLLLRNRATPISQVSPISYGSFALDDGNYTLSDSDRLAILKECPDAEGLIRQFVGGQELIRGETRWCLWLVDALPEYIRRCLPIRTRVEKVALWRAASDRITTRELAKTAAVFAEIRQPSKDYLAFPTVSPVRRDYIPIAFLSRSVIASNQIYVLPDATMYDFGVLTSRMHMAWIAAVCGRMKSDYRYSASIVYNNFPWPQPTDRQRAVLTSAAQNVLDARAKFSSATLADLYDPVSMPPELTTAHRALDRAVDVAYGRTNFKSEAERVAFLFERYEKLVAPLDAQAPVKKRRTARKRETKV